MTHKIAFSNGNDLATVDEAEFFSEIDVTDGNHMMDIKPNRYPLPQSDDSLDIFNNECKNESQDIDIDDNNSNNNNNHLHAIHRIY